MKTNKKHLLKKGFLLFTFLLILINCKKDQEHQETHNHQRSDYTISKITLNEILQNENLSKSLAHLEKELSKNQNNQKSTVYFNQFDFYIETNSATYIENSEGTHHTYTFSIIRKIDTGLIENLVFTLQDDDTYLTHIVSYDLTEQEIEDLHNGIEVDFENKIVLIEIDGTTLVSEVINKQEAFTDCLTVITQWCSYGNHDGGILPDGSPCPGYSSTSETTCWSSGGGTSNNNGNGEGEGNEGSSNNQSGGGTNNGSDPETNPIVTTPETLDYVNLLALSLYGDEILNGTMNLADVELDLKNNLTIEQVTDIYNFLLNNNFSQEAKGFAILARDAIENNGEVDFASDFFEYLIKSPNLDTCPNDILSNLKNIQTDDIANIFARFNTTSSVYNWEIISGTPPINSSNSAETDWRRDTNDEVIDYNYITYINQSYTNQATQIGVARVILHEMLHAYLISLVDDTLITGSTDVTNFPLLWNALVNQTYDNNPNQLQHEIIARKFIDPLRDALIEWYNGSQSNQYYEDLAWGALLDTGSFNALYPIGSERDRIKATNLAEDTNSPATFGLITVNPLGNPCP
jgi:hypothetical protein